MDVKGKITLWLAALGISSGSAFFIADAFIAQKEGLSLRAYQDGAKVWTVCYGKTRGVTEATLMSREACESWRRQEVASRLAFVKAQLPLEMPQTRLAALTSFCFNVGFDACAASTAFKLFKENKPEQGCKALLKWRFITRNGQKIDCSRPNPYCAGLWQRRQEEAALCLMEADNGKA